MACWVSNKATKAMIKTRIQAWARDRRGFESSSVPAGDLVALEAFAEELEGSYRASPKLHDRGL